MVGEPALSKRIHPGVAAISILIRGRGYEAQVIMAVRLTGDWDFPLIHDAAAGCHGEARTCEMTQITHAAYWYYCQDPQGY